MKPITYWLRWGGEFLTTVQASPKATADEVRRLAIAKNRAVPLCYPMAPYLFEFRLGFAEVVSYPKIP